jgi:RNA polymerase sigma-B factor
VSDAALPGRPGSSFTDLFERLPDERAREQLLRLHQPLAGYLARRFGGRGEPIEDLVQVANIGLLNAIDRFDPSRGVQFETYAAATIVGELKRHLRDKGWAVRVPRRLQETGLRMNRALPRLSQELRRSPTIAEIARHLELPVEEIVEAMDAMQAYSTTSLDAPIGADGLTPADTIEHDDDSLEILEAWASIAPKVRELPKRERTILYLRFFRGLTQTEIAREMGISQMHVSRLLNQSLSRLREAVRE